jgi:hypothetical protein
VSRQIAGYFEGARIEVEWRDGRQMVIVHLPAAEIAQGAPNALVMILRGQQDRYSWIDTAGVHTEFVHDEEVDRRIVELIDLLAHLRELYPQMIQLPLLTTAEERVELLSEAAA